VNGDKRAALTQLGARVVITPNAAPGQHDHFQRVARRLPDSWDRYRSKPWMRGWQEAS